MAISLPKVQIARNCLASLLRPIVRFCLRHSLTVQDFETEARRLFVRESANALGLKGTERGAASRISIYTGVRRGEVALHLSDKPIKERSYESYFTRIIGCWLSDRGFSNTKGPLPLSFDGEESEFYNLVRKVTGDVHPGTVLTEFRRLNLVTEQKGKLALIKEAFEPTADMEQGFRILSIDCDDLIQAAEENLVGAKVKNHHATTEYTNIAEDSVEEVRHWLLEQAEQLHKRLRDYLSKRDLDLNPKAKSPGGWRVMLGSFSRISKNQSEE